MRTLSSNRWSRTLPLTALSFLAACGGLESAERTPPLPAAHVRVQSVTTETRVATEDVPGTVRAALRATVEAKVSGRVIVFPVVAGQTVHRGDRLVQLEAKEIRARLNQARARLDQALGDRDRFARLLKRQSVTQRTYDDAQASYRIARAAVDEARTMLGYTTIVAPFDGIVSAKWADVGDLAVPGKPLLVLEDPTTMQVEADVSEMLIGHLHHGDMLSVRSTALPAGINAPIKEIAPAVDPASRTLRIKLGLPPGTGLRLGQFVRVAVPIGKVRAPRVPVSAVIHRGQLQMVFVAADHHAQMRLVRTGRRSGTEIEILSGLSGGEHVVVEGAATLVDGQALEPR